MISCKTTEEPTVAYGALIVHIQGLDDVVELQLTAAVRDPGVIPTIPQPCCTPGE